MQFAAAINGEGTTAGLADEERLLSEDALEVLARAIARIRTDYVREVEDEEFVEVALREVRQKYSEPPTVSESEILAAVIDGMLGSLDRYSSYLDEKDWRAFRQNVKGEYGGLGIQVRRGEEGIEIVAPFEGTPAARAGLRSGDVIIRADGIPLGSITLRKAMRHLRGKPGTRVVITIMRSGHPEFDATIVRDTVRLRGVRSRVEGKIGYLRILRFTDDAGDEVTAAIRDLHEKTGGAMRGLVLDLRTNPGGLLNEAVEISDVFLAGGQIVTTRLRHRDVREQAGDSDALNGLPMVVLINKASASASEVVAGALQDRGRALLVGTRSYGKDTIQRVFPLGNGSAIKITVGRYLTPAGRAIAGGLTPDIAILDDKSRDGDEQLVKALEILRAHGG